MPPIQPQNRRFRAAARCRRPRAWLALAALWPLAACVSPGASVPAAQPLAGLPAAATLGTSDAPGAMAAGFPARPLWPADGWWQGWGDPQLDALIAEGLANAPDVATAAARFRKAEALAGSAGAALLPALDAQASVSEAKISYNQGYPPQFVALLPHGWHDEGRLALNFNFDPDIWGANRARLAAAISARSAAAVDVAAARLALESGIAAAYADFAEAVALRDLRQAALDNNAHVETIVGQRYAQGLDRLPAQRLAAADTANARADLAAAERLVSLRRDELAALVGAGPDRGLALTVPQLAPAAPAAIPADVSTALIGRRPDLVAARARVEAAGGQVRAAKADFFPAIKLSALVGYSSLPLSMLLDRSSTFGTAGPALTLPIFHGGALRAAYRGARADYDTAVGDYNGKVVDAYRQVADAVASRQRLAEQLANARVALAAGRDAFTIATQRYQGGLANDLEVLTAQQRLVAAQVAVAMLEAQARGAEVDLIRALGGGFAGAAAGAAPPPHPAPPATDAPGATKDPAR